MQGIRVGAVVAPVTRSTAYHGGRADFVRKRLVGAVDLPMMADFEQDGAQLFVCDAAVAGEVGVAGQQDTGIPVIQPQDQAVIVHARVQCGQLLQKCSRVGFRVERGSLLLKHLRGQAGAERDGLARLQGPDRAAACLGERAERDVIVQRAQEFALRRVLRDGHIERMQAAVIIRRQGLPELGGREKPRRLEQSADVVLVRMGADIKVKCLGCGAIIMFSRRDFEKRLKKVVQVAEVKEE